MTLDPKVREMLESKPGSPPIGTVPVDAMRAEAPPHRTPTTPTGMASNGLLLLLAGAARAAEEAAIDAEDILTQAEEANALDPVG